MNILNFILRNTWQNNIFKNKYNKIYYSCTYKKQNLDILLNSDGVHIKDEF